MKKRELKKIYKYDEVGKKFILQVQLEDYRDAYSNWDFSPFINRDLDGDLTDYLLACSYEIPHQYLIELNFHLLNQVSNQQREDKSILGMRNYFGYQIRRLSSERISAIKDILLFTILGVVLLVVGIYFSEFSGETLATKVLSEGFFIGGWVMLWEMFSSWFFDLKKLGKKRQHFLRLQRAEIIYSYEKI